MNYLKKSSDNNLSEEHQNVDLPISDCKTQKIPDISSLFPKKEVDPFMEKLSIVLDDTKKIPPIYSAQSKLSQSGLPYDQIDSDGVKVFTPSSNHSIEQCESNSDTDAFEDFMRQKHQLQETFFSQNSDNISKNIENSVSSDREYDENSVLLSIQNNVSEMIEQRKITHNIERQFLEYSIENISRDDNCNSVNNVPTQDTSPDIICQDIGSNISSDTEVLENLNFSDNSFISEQQTENFVNNETVNYNDNDYDNICENIDDTDDYDDDDDEYDYDYDYKNFDFKAAFSKIAFDSKNKIFSHFPKNKKIAFLIKKKNHVAIELENIEQEEIPDSIKCKKKKQKIKNFSNKIKQSKQNCLEQCKTNKQKMIESKNTRKQKSVERKEKRKQDFIQNYAWCFNGEDYPPEMIEKYERNRLKLISKLQKVASKILEIHEKHIQNKILSGKPVESESSLMYTHPAIASEWHFKRNQKLTCDDVNSYYKKQVWWTCNKCRKNYQASVYDRVYKHVGCPACAAGVRRPTPIKHSSITAQNCRRKPSYSA